MRTRDLRGLSFACFAFNGIQSVFTAYFVTFLVAMGYQLAAAGVLFSFVVAPRRPVPRPVGLARQLSCRAAPGDGGAGSRHGGQCRGDQLGRRGHGRRLPSP